MAKKKLKKLLLNGEAYDLPDNSDYVDLSTNQTVGGTKTFTTSPVVPNKTSDASNTGTAIATEAQVYKKQDTLIAGANIQIANDGKTISSTDTTYTAGTGIDITNGVISNTQTSAEWGNITGTLSDQTDLQNALNAKQDTLIAGTNIQIANDGKTISATDTTYSEVTKSAIDTGTSTTAGVVSAKTIADYVGGKIANAYIYKGTVSTYADLPSTGLTAGDVYNVETAHTTDPKFPAGSNLAWNGTAWDVLGGMFDTSQFVDISTNQTIGGIKTFSTSPVVPSKTASATNTGTAIATEAQVYKKQDTLTAGTNITISSNTISAKGDMAYADFNWATKSGATITLDLNSTIIPSANFTVNAPETIKEGQEYMLRVYNGSTVYTMTLGTNITNPRNVDLTLSESKTDQFKFIGVGGKLELQPEMVISVNGQNGIVTLDADDISDTNTTNKFVTATDKTNWNAKADTSDIGNGTITYKQGISSTAIGTITTNQSSNGTITFHDNVVVTQTDYNNLPSSKATDGNSYWIYETVS